MIKEYRKCIWDSEIGTHFEREKGAVVIGGSELATVLRALRKAGERELAWKITQEDQGWNRCERCGNLSRFLQTSYYSQVPMCLNCREELQASNIRYLGKGNRR